MNPDLDRLNPYPFERLRMLLTDSHPSPDVVAGKPEIRLYIGEPQHATPTFIKEALAGALDGLASYPSTLGIPALREAIAAWLGQRYQIPPLDPQTQILPVNGSREALFSFVQAAIDHSRHQTPLVVCPNPFYQIYEGAALLAQAEPRFLNTLPGNGFSFDYSTLSADEWARVQVLFVCSPGNPTGKVLSLDEWRELFALSDRYGFIIAADECYSEIYFDEARPPLGALQAAHRLGRDYSRLLVFSSLSKRSNVPGLRSGFVAGDETIVQRFLLYRTYHGCAMNPTVQKASIAAWNDEAHVRENRALYREKFDRITPPITQLLETERPDAGFYFWAKTPIADTEFTRRLYATQNLIVLPGRFLARMANNVNPGENFVRIALVAPLAECVQAVSRLEAFIKTL